MQAGAQGAIERVGEFGMHQALAKIVKKCVLAAIGVINNLVG